jgi:beta-1,4-mannosyl-glycoprotein beta-1,4-N-acetylglucosaminyltransferase
MIKIFDAFPFFNELELLEIRLEELYNDVDYFIICESTKTHQNKPKKLYYLENKEKFKKFQDKIIHHVFDPQEYPYQWYIENEQRKELKIPISKLISENDYVLLSDADEIIDKKIVKEIRRNPLEFQRPKTCIMQMSYNFINTVVKSPWHHAGWRGTVIVPANYFLKNNLHYWREQKDELERVENAGWHFSFLGGTERIKIKIESYGHAEFNNEAYTNIENIENRIKNLLDPLGRNYFVIEKETNFDKFPESSLKFKNLFY